jgi:hypothetical protein
VATRVPAAAVARATVVVAVRIAANRQAAGVVVKARLDSRLDDVHKCAVY